MSTKQSKQLEFFFDFLSPFAYLAHQKLPGLAQRYGYTLRFVPFDLPRAKPAKTRESDERRDRRADDRTGPRLVQSLLRNSSRPSCAL